MQKRKKCNQIGL